MFFKTKRKKEFSVLKLYKVIDINDTISFKDILYYIFNIFNKIRIDYFEVNFCEKKIKTVDNLYKLIEKKEFKNIENITVFNKETEQMVSVSKMEHLEEYSIEILIAVLKDEFTEKEIISFVEDFIKKVTSIDYGYSLSLDETYDFKTERKIKRSLFGSPSISILQSDIDWNNKHSTISDGSYRKIYKHNFFNKNHLLKKEIININKNNNSKQITEDLYYFTTDANNENKTK